ncbi:hypothetical protein B586_17220 [Mycobacterium haemophilum DSM 44634]|nr:hypothetical protein B586_17220 [Mycobacterium haemophilum DSM 44634]
MRNEVGMLISTVDPAELRQAADALYNLATDLHAGGVDAIEPMACRRLLDDRGHQHHRPGLI